MFLRISPIFAVFLPKEKTVTWSSNDTVFIKNARKIMFCMLLCFLVVSNNLPGSVSVNNMEKELNDKRIYDNWRDVRGVFLSKTQKYFWQIKN